MSTATDSRLGNNNKKLMAWLKVQRVDRGLSMRDLGDKLGTPHSRVGKYENLDRRLDVPEYFEVCAAIGCDPFVGLQLVYGGNHAKA